LAGVILLIPLLVLLGRLPSGSLWGMMGPVIIFSSFFFISTGAVPLYLFFELSLLPVLFMIFLWGAQPERSSAFYYLIIYSVFSAFPLLLLLFTLNTGPLLDICRQQSG